MMTPPPGVTAGDSLTTHARALAAAAPDTATAPGPTSRAAGPPGRGSLALEVLDTVTGRPAGVCSVRVDRRGEHGWMPRARLRTGSDGRVLTPLAPGGAHRITVEPQSESRLVAEVSFTLSPSRSSCPYAVTVLLAPAGAQIAVRPGHLLPVLEADTPSGQDLPPGTAG